MHYAVTLSGHVFARAHATMLRVVARARRFAPLTLDRIACDDTAVATTTTTTTASSPSLLHDAQGVRALCERAVTATAQRDGVDHHDNNNDNDNVDKDTTTLARLFVSARVHVWVSVAMQTALSLPLRADAGAAVVFQTDAHGGGGGSGGGGAHVAFYHITQLDITVAEALARWRRYATQTTRRVRDGQLCDDDDDDAAAVAAAAVVDTSNMRDTTHACGADGSNSSNSKVEQLTLPPHLLPRNTNGERFARRVEAAMWSRAATMLSLSQQQQSPPHTPTAAATTAHVRAPSAYWATADEASYVYDAPFDAHVLVHTTPAVPTTTTTMATARELPVYAIDVPHRLTAFPLRYYNVGMSSRPHRFSDTTCRRYDACNVYGEPYHAATTLAMKRAAIADGCMSQPHWASTIHVRRVGAWLRPRATLVRVTLRDKTLQLVNVNMTSHPTLVLRGCAAPLLHAHTRAMASSTMVRYDASASVAHTTPYTMRPCRCRVARVAPVTAMDLFALQHRRDVLSYHLWEHNSRRSSDKNDNSNSSSSLAHAFRQASVSQRFTLADRAAALHDEWAQLASRACEHDVV